MSINCGKIVKFMGEELFQYFMKADKLTGDAKKEFLKLIKDKGFKDEQHFFMYIGKKYPELKEYTEILSKGYEAAKVTTSHTYGFIDANFKASQYDYTISELEKILLETNKTKQQAYITDLKKQIESQKTHLNAFENTLKGEIDIEKRKEIGEKIGKLIMEPDVILDNLDDLRKLKSTIEYLKNRKAEYYIKSINMGEIANNLNRKMGKYLEDNEVFFLDKKTVERNLGRIIGKDGFKRYNNLYEIYKNSYGKFNDIIKGQYVKNTNNQYYILSDIVNKINKSKGYKFQIIKQEGDKFYIKDSISGDVLVFDKNMTGEEIEKNIVQYMKLFDGSGISSAANTSVGDKSLLNASIGNIADIVDREFKQIIDNTQDTIDIVNDLYKGIDELDNEGLIELSNKLEELGEDLVVTHQSLANLLLTMPDRISGKLKEQLQDIITDKFLSSFWFTQLMTNIEIIEQYNPTFARFLKKVELANETLIKDVQSKIVGETYKVFKSEKGKDFIKHVDDNISLYVLKELLYNNNVHTEDIQRITSKYHNLKKQGLNNEEIYRKLANDIAELGVKGGREDVIYQDLQKIENVFNESKNIQSNGIGFYGYLYNKYNIGGLNGIIKNIVKGYDNVLGISDDIFTDQLTKSISNVFNTHKNIISSFSVIRTSMKHIDDAMSAIPGNANYFKNQLKLVTDSANSRERIMSDLYGDSLYGSSWWWRIFGSMRNLTYRIKMTAFGGKGISIAMQNLVSNFIEGVSLFGHYDNTYKEFHKTINKLDKNNPIFKLYREVFNASENEISKYADEAQQDYITRLRIWFINKYYDNIENFFSKGKLEEIKKDLRQGKVDKYGIRVNDKFLKNEKAIDYMAKNILEKQKLDKLAADIEKKGTKTTSVILNPSGIVDDMSKDMYLKDMIYNKIIQEKGIDINEFKKLVDLVNKGDTQAQIKLEKLIQEVQAEVLYEYNTFFKIAYTTGLTRNSFSRWLLLNHFGSWGSKKFGDYMYHIFLNPIRTAVSVGRHAGSIKSGVEAGLISLMTDQKFQAFLKQLWMLQVAIYNIEKNPDADVDPVQFVRDNSILMQAVNTYVVTRAIHEGIKIANMDNSNYAYGIVNALSTLGKSILAEPRFILSLPALLSQDTYNNGFKLDRLLDLSKLWLFNKMNSSFLYSMFDYYKGEYQTAFDRKTQLHTLEALLGIPFTKYGDEKWDLLRMKRIASILRGDENFIENLSLELGLYSTELDEYEANEFNKKLENDVILSKLKQRAELWTDNPEVVDTIWRKVKNSGLLTGWDPDKDGSYVKNDMLALALQEIRNKGYEPDVIISAIRNGIISGKDKDIIKIFTLMDSKAHSAVLFSYVLNQIYKDKRKEYKQLLGVKTLPIEERVKLKEDILKMGLPIMAMLDKNLHAEILGEYIQDQYKDNVDLYTSDLKLRNSVKNNLLLKFFSQIIDIGEANFDTTKFNAVPVKIARDIIKMYPKDKQVDVFNKLFDKISKWTTTEQGRIITQAAMLYANKGLISKLLTINPDKYKKAAKKLANVIWDTNDKLDQLALELIGGQRGNKGIRLAKGDRLSKEQIKLGKSIKNGIKQLAKGIVKNPNLKNVYIKRIYSKIDLKIKPFKYDTKIKQPEFKYRNPESIRSKLLEVKKQYLKSKRVRKPKTSSIKKVYR